MVEYDFDDQDDFCLADLDLPAVPELYCDPLYHKFVKKIYFNVVTWECKDCELNLHYDKKTDGYTIINDLLE